MHLPTDRELVRQRFHSDGYVVIRNLYSPTEIREIQAAIKRYIVEIVPHLPPMDVFYQEKGDSGTIKMLPRLHHHDSFIDGMLRGGRLPDIAEFLWSTSARPKDAAFFDKPATIGQATPPHQDGYYFHLNPCEAMTLWLALDEIDEQNGCVRYIPGSHRKTMRPHNRTGVLGFSQGIADYCEVDQESEVAVCAMPGDLIVHDALTIHRADRNRSDTRSRQALGFVYYSSRAKVDQSSVDAYQQTLEDELKSAGKI